MNNTTYLTADEVAQTLEDNPLMSAFNNAQPNRPTALNDIFTDVGNFFTNTGKSAENANKITERLDKNLEKSFPFILAAGIIFGAMALSQTIKNVQEIQKNAK